MYVYIYICIDISSTIIYDMFCNWTNKLEFPTCTSHTQIHISSSVDWKRIREANTSSPNMPKFSRNSFLPLKCPMRWKIILPMRMAFSYVWLKWGKIVSSLTRPKYHIHVHKFIMPSTICYINFVWFYTPSIPVIPSVTAVYPQFLLVRSTGSMQWLSIFSD